MQLVKDPAGVVVDFRQGVAVKVSVRGPGKLGRGPDHDMQHRVCQVQEERLPLLLAPQEADRFIRVALGQRAHVVGRLELLHVPPERDSSVVVRAKRAKKVVEALVVRKQALQRPASAHVPFPDGRSCVASFAEHFGGCHLVRTDGPAAADATGMAPRHERPSRRAANSLRIEAREAGAFLRHAVETRGAVLLRPVTSQVAIADVVQEDDDEIGAFMRGVW